MYGAELEERDSHDSSRAFAGDGNTVRGHITSLIIDVPVAQRQSTLPRQSFARLSRADA